MNNPTISVVCWRHGTAVRIKAVALAHNEQFTVSIEKCPDCSREDRQNGYNEHKVESTPERHEMGG